MIESKFKILNQKDYWVGRNEHYGIFNYLKGIETIPHFFMNYANAH